MVVYLHDMGTSLSSDEESVSFAAPHVRILGAEQPAGISEA